MNTKLIKDLLSEEEISSILSSIQKEIDSRPILKEDKPTSTIHPDDATLYWKDFGRIDIRYPMLNPHFDVSDVSTVFLDYQLDSNTMWPIAVEQDVFELENNSALLFESVGNIHYRPIKNFLDKEFVKMLFFRFSTSKNLPEKTKEDYKRLYEIEVKYDPSKDIGRG